MSPFWLKFSQMILHTETSKLMYNWSFLFEVLHKPTLLPSTFKYITKSVLKLVGPANNMHALFYDSQVLACWEIHIVYYS